HRRRRRSGLVGRGAARSRPRPGGGQAHRRLIAGPPLPKVPAQQRGGRRVAAVEVWGGGVNTWECDRMGHMNVRFYVAKAMDGLAGLAAELGMPQVFAPGAHATLMVREHHIRFLREAHPGAYLYMTGGVLEMEECEARVLLTFFHPNGEPCATFNAKVAHVTAGDGRPFPWPERIRERANALRTELADYAAPRSIDLHPVESAASLERAEALDLRRA